MQARWVEVMVGVFIMLGFVAILGLAVKASGLNVLQNKDHYTIYARFEHIGGLTERAKVTLSGVQIGEVSHIAIDTERMMAVVALSISDQYRILTTDSSAQILTAGLLGEQYIGMSVGFEETVLQEGDYIQDTQSALVLEDLVGKFLFNKVSE